MHIPKWLMAMAGLLLVVLIALVAFFIGRDTSQPREAPIADSAPVAEASSATTSPITASTSGTAATEAPPATASASLASAPAAAEDTSQPTAEARARVSAYFEQMEALQAGEVVADQEAFATTVLQGAVSGDFSAIDDLVRAAGDAERRAVALQPPGECAEYHRMAVTLLQESRTMIAALRDGLKRNDTNTLASVGASAQSMKSRADTLAAAEKALRARFGV
jgi:hypothetical protein